MKRFTLLFLCNLWLSGGLFAQDSTATRRDSLPTPAVSGSADELLAGLTDSTEAAPLLPRRLIITQRVFWGPKGLLRIMNVAPLTPEGRIKELTIRRTMLAAHQITGFITLAGFVAQGLVGSRLYKSEGEAYTRIKKTHEMLATGINITYTTSALLALVAPPKIVGERRGLSSIKAHKYLAIVHMAGMIATNILAGKVSEQRNLADYQRLKSWHRAAAYTTFGAYAVSVIALKF